MAHEKGQKSVTSAPVFKYTGDKPDQGVKFNSLVKSKVIFGTWSDCSVKKCDVLVNSCDEHIICNLPVHHYFALHIKVVRHDHITVTIHLYF